MVLSVAIIAKAYCYAVRRGIFYTRELNNQNFLVKEMLEVNDETQSVIATLTNHKGEEVFFTGGFSQWFEGLIK